MILRTDHLSLREILALRDKGEIEIGGHRSNKIYGTLDCKGAKMWLSKGHYVKQRVFFKSEEEAIHNGYRPCARCMPEKYKRWKSETSQN